MDRNALAARVHALDQTWQMDGFVGIYDAQGTIVQDGVPEKTRFVISAHAPFLLGYCALRMQRHGMIDLGRSLREYLTDCPFSESVEAALRHETDIPDFLYALPLPDDPVQACMCADRAYAAQEIFRILADTPQQTPHGAYSASNVFLAQAALEAAGGKPLDALLQEWVFAPLGMTDTGHGVPDMDCVLEDDTVIAPPCAGTLRGALSTTPRDMARLLTALACGEGLTQRQARMLYAQNGRNGVCFARVQGMQSACMQVLGFSCNLYLHPQSGVRFLHMDAKPQQMALEDGQWTYFRRQLREAVEEFVVYPAQPRFVRYDLATMRAATQIRLAPEQYAYVMDARDCLCRAYAMGRRARAFVLCQQDVAVGLAVLEVDKRRGVYSIDALQIDARFQGRGFGKILLSCCIDALRRQGAVKIDVGLSAHNETAYTLYRAAGFETVAQDAQEILMQLRI
jgi:diamine N-acetyltransferase